MKKLGIVLSLIILFGCAKVSVETKKPLKVDINMRLDVYQHVVKEAESIEDQIYNSDNTQMNSILGIAAVYAEDNLSEAIERRKQRAAKIKDFFNKGYIGENRNGYLELIKNETPSQIREVIAKENKDRKVIYENTAKKNNTKLSAVEKIFFKDHYQRAPSGWYFEVHSQSKEKYIWQKK
ncbi:MAG: YdbL family protein [Candidatus Omnitrophica bacterium]|nr:YdbL family protein [Candidatus Omnitrophota bacterium]MCF7895319.1 YdbL family protein [Candidatus Omnitrophota bacterium]